MGYIGELGIGLGKERDVEKKVASLLLSREGPEEFNPELNMRSYLFYLRAYSRDRDKREYQRILKDNYRSNDSGWEATYKLERMLTYLSSPVQDIKQILARQALIKKYIAAQTGEGDKVLVGLTEEIMRNHYALYTNLPIDRDQVSLKEIAGPFVRTVESLSRFRKRYSTDPQLKEFAARIGELFEENPIIGMAVLLEKGGVLVVGSDKIASLADRVAKEERRLEQEKRKRQNTWGSPEEDSSTQSRPNGSEFWLSRSAPTGKGVFDLGLFRMGENGKLKHYPNQERDIRDMISFTRDCSALVYTIGSMYYQADIYNRLKRLGLPACIPKVNDEGRFRVQKGHPIATDLREDPVLMNIFYDREHRRFIVGGAHSGGKTELLRNIGLFHATGLGGGIWPAEEGEVPLTTRIITSIKKTHEEKKGSLESELKNSMEIDKTMGQRDLVLIDEWLDTTKPELARHVSQPLLFGEVGLCRGFAQSPGTIYIVDHRAPSIHENKGFEFMYPVLAREKASKLARILKQRLRYEGETNSDLEFYLSLRNKTVLIPTYTFAVGKPNPEEVREHALQMWQRVLQGNKHERGDYRGKEFEDYGVEERSEGAREEDGSGGKYVIWQVPGKSRGIWINNPEANKGQHSEDESEEQDPPEDTPEPPWANDEIVLPEDSLPKESKPSQALDGKPPAVQEELDLSIPEDDEPPF